MKKKIAKKRAAALGSMQNIRKKQSRNMCQNSYFLCLQEIRMPRSIKEEQKTDIWSAKKKTEQPKNKFMALLKNLLKSKFKKNVIKTN